MNEDVHFVLLQFCDCMISLYRKNRDTLHATPMSPALIYIYDDVSSLLLQCPENIIVLLALRDLILYIYFQIHIYTSNTGSPGQQVRSGSERYVARHTHGCAQAGIKGNGPALMQPLSERGQPLLRLLTALPQTAVMQGGTAALAALALSLGSQNRKRGL